MNLVYMAGIRKILMLLISGVLELMIDILDFSLEGYMCIKNILFIIVY